MPAGFDPPRYGWIEDQPFWIPFGATAGNRSWGRVLHVVARLKPNASLEQANADLRALSERHQNDAPRNKGWSAHAIPLARQITGDVRRPLIVLFSAVALLMLIATVNVASLVATFAQARQHELHIRTAIGASRTRLIRQQLVQSLVLGGIGLMVGLALAYAGTRGLVALVPPSVPRVDEIRVSLPVVMFASIAALAATLGFGLMAAVRAMHAGVSRAGTGRVYARFDGTRLIAAEIAIGLVLTVLASLMIRSFSNLRSVDMGFDSQSTVAARLSLPSARYTDDGARTRFFDEVIARVRATPGVTGATLATTRPLACCAASTAVRDPSRAVPEESAPIADVRFVDEAYFATMRIPVAGGAVFGRGEPVSGPPRAVVSRALAKTIWGDENPIGKTLSIKLYGTMDAQVIGLVGDVHLVGPRTPVRPGAYLYARRYPSSERDIVVRGSVDPAALLGELRKIVADLDPAVPLASATTLEDSIDQTLASDRFTALLLGGFALLALLLAAVGVYGVLAGEVGRRRKEIGIRLALGAHPSGVTALVVRRAMRPAVIGVAIGVGLALLLARSLSSLLFGIRASDPATFAFVATVLLVVAAVATLIPAMRAMRTSPLEAIRMD
jgi:putative ABC transport system permease protein